MTMKQEFDEQRFEQALLRELESSSVLVVLFFAFAAVLVLVAAMLPGWVR